MRRGRILLPIVVSLVLHAYIAWRLVADLALTSTGSAALFGYLLASSLLTPAALLLRLSRFSERSASLLAWVSYVAMGAFSTMFVLCLVRDLVLGLVCSWDRLWPDVLAAHAHARGAQLAHVQQVSAQLVIVTTVAVSILGAFNARRVAKVLRVDLPIADLPAGLQGFTIAQLSDIHVGPTIKSKYVEAIVQRVNGLSADLVAITGDMVDGSVEQLREHVAPLAQLRARHGTYCVTGNHEYYHGAEAWVAEWRRLGLHVLVNQSEVLQHNGERLLIGGVTDFNAQRYIAAHRSDAIAAAQHDGPVATKILLAHQPRSAPAASEAGFQVQLSGHTHGGQFLPWNFFVPLQQPVVSGLKRLDNLWLYVSSGTGYWGPPLRLFAPSEITLLRLVAAHRAQ